MSQTRTISEEIYYPESDGVPLAENDVQYRNIVTIKENLLKQYKSRSHEVYIGSDLFWYPVEDEPKICAAPDVLVALGRPQADRRCYQQWEEGKVTPQVVFEVWSPSNRGPEKRDKLDFYDTHGVQEYYAYDPDEGVLEGWQRGQTGLNRIEQMQGWVSPLLGVRFELEGAKLVMYGPDNEPWVPPQVWAEREAQAQERATREYNRAEHEQERAAREYSRAEYEHEQAERQLQRAEQERIAKERAWAKLRELNIDPEKLI